MFLKEIKRIDNNSNGKIKTLWEFVRIIDLLYKKPYGFIVDELPFCILIHKMFGFDLTKINDVYFICYENKVYDLKKLIDISVDNQTLYKKFYKINDMDYAWIKYFEWYHKINVDKLLSNKEIKDRYDNLIIEINNYIKKFDKNKFIDGFDIFGFDENGYNRFGIDINGRKKGYIYTDVEDRIGSSNINLNPKNKSGYHSSLYKDADYSDWITDINNSRCEKKETNIGFGANGETVYYNVDLVRKQIEEDYDINIDDVESDYYEESLSNEYEDLF